MEAEGLLEGETESEDREQEIVYSIAPNPGTDEISIDVLGNDGTAYTLTIVNALGQLVHRQQLSVEDSEGFRLDVSQLKVGSYSFIFHSDYGSRVVKWMKIE
jgi:hypothetical protein